MGNNIIINANSQRRRYKRHNKAPELEVPQSGINAINVTVYSESGRYKRKNKPPELEVPQSGDQSHKLYC